MFQSKEYEKVPSFDSNNDDSAFQSRRSPALLISWLAASLFATTTFVLLFMLQSHLGSPTPNTLGTFESGYLTEFGERYCDAQTTLLLLG